MAPKLSSILPAWDSFESISTVLQHLSRQTVAGDMEVVFVCPVADDFQVQPDAVARFQSYRVIELGQIDTRSRAFAEGIRVATAPLVVLCEDHCFPVPGWAEALINRHESDSYVAVGPMFENANPENVISDVDLLMAYGPFLQGLPGGDAEFVAGHNSCYRRDVLIAEDTVDPADSPTTRRTANDTLAQVLEAEYVYHTRLSSEGKAFYTEPAARVYHMNFATWSSALKANFLAAKLFGAVRAQSWPLSRRTIFAAAGFAVPFLRASRILPLARTAGWSWSRILSALPVLMVVLYANALGEWLGNLQGSRVSVPNLVHYEFHRYRFSPMLTQDVRRRSALLFN